MALKNTHYRKIILGALLLSTLSGCRFGNYSEQPTVVPNASGGFASIELFSAHTSRLETIALYSDNTRSYRDNVALASVPTSILDTFSDPVYFTTPSDVNDSPMFIGKNQKNYINTTLNSAGAIADQSASEIVTLWNNPACQTQIQIEQAGSLDRSHPGSTVLDGKTQPIAGKLKLELTYMRVLAGDCVSDLQDMAQCYQDSSTCTTDEWRAATNFFDLYVRQSGVLRIEDAIRIKALAYIVTFE